MPSVSPGLLARLAEFVAERTALCFPQARWGELERGIGSAAREWGFANAESYIDWLLGSTPTRREVETVASHLTVGETYFFRERKSFEAFEQHILPDLVRLRQATERRLRIWSAGCATGPEPYSIAILLHKNLPDLKDWNVTLLGTDINPAFLRRAAEGEFNSWAFREGLEEVNGTYFEKTRKDHLKVCRPIQQMVTFAYLNLAEDVYPSLLNNTNAMDVIFCRNVLMYFTPRSAEKVVERLYRCLVEGGWLLVSPVERSQAVFSRFATVSVDGVQCYRKESEQAPCSRRVEDRSDDHRLLPEQELPGISDVVEVANPAATMDLETAEASEASEGSTSSPGQQLEAALSGPPGPTVDAYREALALYEQGRYAEAEQEASDLLLREPDRPEAMGLLARVYANRGRLGEALAWCEKAIAADKLEPGYHFLRANILHEQGVFEEASLSLRRALYLEPKFVLAYFALGSLALQQGRAGAARKYFHCARALAGARPAGEVLSESDGITAGRLTEIIARHWENSGESASGEVE